MSAEPVALAPGAPTDGSAEPLYFTSGEHALFGWLHQSATQPSATTGLVICKPFGYEAQCAHRSLRAFADAASALGMPALRFDYLGAGDSADIDPAADQIESWLRDVAAAVGELRRRTAVQRVCLLGFRLGALLAVLAAERSSAVDALILVAPVLSGRRYLRELRTTQLAAAAGDDVPAASSGGLEVGGYPLSAASIAQLSQIELSTVTRPPAAQILMIDRKDLPVGSAWCEKLAQLGAQARYLALPGFVEMMMTPPQFAVVPREMLAASREWLLTLPGIVAPHDERREPSAIAVQPAASTPTLKVPGGNGGTEVTERPVCLGTAPTLFGIVAEPAPTELRGRAVILLNPGADHHIGAGRMYVSLARRWARRGYVVLRMDLAGLGDSATRSGQPDDQVFPAAVLEDVRVAVDFMRSHYRVSDLTLAGLCSAAYHTLRAAVAGLPLDRVLMVNPQNFSWKESMEVGEVQMVDVVRDLRVYRTRALSANTWKRLLLGQIDVAAVARIYLHRARIVAESRVRDIARWLRIRLPRDLGWELEEIAQRGVRVVFVFARGDPGVELLRIQGGSAVKRLGDLCRVHIIDSADHTFTRSGPRAALEQVLSDELFVRHRPA
jgi:alpha-beta hydrolase superfamily lysophospholipase